MKLLITYITLLISCMSQAQDWKRAAVWYFGYNAGLDFNTNPPVALTDGLVNSIEGCASICDIKGNLVLYSDGQTIWNKDHQILINGTGLKGTSSTTQNSVFIPIMEGDSMFLLFTLDGGGAGVGQGLNYNLINANSSLGYGEVIQKNQHLLTGLTEKMAVTRHDNGRDYWLVVHGANDNVYNTYLVGFDGSISCPILNKIGTTFNGTIHKAGAMNFDPAGQRLATSLWSSGKVEILDFNSQTGELKNVVSIENLGWVYGVSFSQKANYLYVSERNGRLLQIEMANPDSIRTVYTNSSIVDIQGLQLTRSGEVLMAINSKPYLSAIRNSDGKGDSCLFDSVAITLNGKSSSYGLPNFITSYFRKETKEIRYALTCPADSGRFSGYSSSPISSWNWELRNSQGTLVGSASSQDVTFSFPDTGRYTVRLIADSDTLFKQVYIEPLLNIGRDTLVCNQPEFILSVPDNFRCIQWQDGSDTNHYSVTQSGTYIARAINYQGCRQSDTVRIDFNQVPQPVITQSSDTLYTDTGFSYQWYYNGNPIGGIQHYLRVSQNGSYAVEITDSVGCSSLSDPFQVTGIYVVLPEKAQFRVYPNPGSTGQTIYINGNESIRSIWVHDLLGKQIFEAKNLNTQEYSIEQLPRGLYMLTINQKQHYTLMIK